MTTSASISQLALFLILALSFSACGNPQAVTGGFDEIESAAPDVGLDIPPVDPETGVPIEEEKEGTPKVCLGRVTTTSSNLNVRNTASLSAQVCGSIPSQSYVTVTNSELLNGFYQITSDNCESETQFVFGTYIELSEDCFENGDDPSPPPPQPEDPEPITNLRSYIQNNITKVSVTRELIRGGAKGLVEVYKLPGSGENIMCGVKHIRSYRSEPFQGIDTLCAWAAVAQEWRKQYCPDNSPDCRIMLGDSSFGERMPSSWPHSTHRRGWCMDIWPMRKDNCGETEVTWQQGCYSREKTAAFVKLLIKHGADKGNQLFFNDPQIPDVRYLSNHDDHIHACFKPANSIVKSRCDNTTVDRDICPEF